MLDPAHVLTDDMLKDLERRVADQYAIAAREMQQKYEKYMEQYKAGLSAQKEQLAAGKITQQDYDNWVYRHTMMNKRWEDMKDVLARDLQHTREIALKIAGEKIPDIYALNHNYGVYEIEHGGKIDTGLTLYNHDTAEYLLGDQRQLMPGPSDRKAAEIAANKAMQWDKEKIQSCVLQGIMQGESVHEVAKRLQDVAKMEYNAAVRYARTMITSAQNAGRYEAFRRADRLGVKLTIEWNAVLDGRTRHAHRMMHGEQTKVDEPFETPDGYTIYYPADCTGTSDAPQSFIWNCRCSLISWVEGYEGDTVKESPGMGDMSFEDWQEAYADYERRGGGSFGSEHEELTGIDRIKHAVADFGNTEGSVADIQRIGRMVKEEIERDLSDPISRAHAIQTEQDALWKEYDQQSRRNSELNRLIKETDDKALKKEYKKELAEGRERKKELAAKMDNMTKDYWSALKGNEHSAKLLEVLSQIREMGGVTESNILKFGNFLMNTGDQKDMTIKSAIEAMIHYPSSWLQKSAEHFTSLKPHWTTERAYYMDSNGEIRFNADKGTNIHELAHRFESVVPGIKWSERDFYDSRTRGLNLEWLGPGYDSWETARKDDFVNSYMGKDYGGSAYELCSMGFQYAYTDYSQLAKDEDMQTWIFGLLAAIP